MNDEMSGVKEHIALQFAADISIDPEYHCSGCEEDLWTERSARTGWQEWYFTRDGRRHYKTKCNLKKGEEKETKSYE